MKTWGFYIAAALAFMAYNAATRVDRDNTGAIVGNGNVDAFEIRVGDCFDDIGTFDDEITNLPGVPCSEPHDNETYAVFDVALDTYPDEETMSYLAHVECVDRFESFVGSDYESSSLDVMTLYPTAQSWLQSDREIVCAVYDMQANKLTGSVKGRAL